ncbi:MAG: hypothetical protein AMJ75_03555 [Phycisphaerae bacterium SM1_79]|nr:MAG: hypothetical protein AMJ75_03555 [Phycisphaerae bacterium SM1_79]
MTTILIGIDDTDNAHSRGTGRLARLLSAECERRGMRPLGVTRHQFLVDPAIPYTSHNSGACIAVETNDNIESARFAFDFVAQRAAEGADPGVCIGQADVIEPDIMEFAKAATHRIVKIQDAFSLAGEAPIELRGLGGTSQGVIGALASVGLRAYGNYGRYIDLPGLRELPRLVDIHCFRRMGITIEYKTNNHKANDNDIFDTLGWVRPRLIKSKPVLMVEWSEENNVWIPIDKSRKKPVL